ncbi:MAG TPA: prolyl oligopeptidase family serine peptidase [Chloroflexia bacterium]|nr:prolyl oligopeptidase family serine peptidase [Chloroflexia bacterium]
MLRPPESRPEPVEEVFHGQTIVDPYRWLEDGDAPEVQAWVAAQNAYTEARLGEYRDREALRRRLGELLATGSVGVPSVRAERYFYTRREGTQNQPLLYVREGLAGAERVLLDPNTASAAATVALDWWYPSEDGRRLAYGYSDQGDEKSTLYVLDVDSGAMLPDTIPHTRHCSLAWEPDGTGFYYTRHPEPGSVPAGEEEYHGHLFHHRLGSDPARDPDLYGAGRAMTDMLDVQLSPDGRWLVLLVSQGWVRDEVYVCDLRSAERAFHPLVTGYDALFYGEVLDGTLYLHTNWKAPRYRVLAVDLEHPAPDDWREVIAQRPDTVIAGMSIIGRHLVLHETRDVVSAIGIYHMGGAARGTPPLPALGTVTGVDGMPDGNDVFLSFESYTVPPTVYRYHLPTGAWSTWAAVEAPVDTNGLAVEQVWFQSKDGTPIPMFIVAPRGLVRDGDTPTVLYGYGGFNVSYSPVFNRSILAWVERGGIYAVANLRGGSEYGEEWHAAGMLGNKQNVFDDFIAAAEYLLASGYTRRERLGILGRSNGGLLVGAALTQRPDLFAAVACMVPLLDMLRYHRFRIARLWVPEYGSAEDAEQFRWLVAYSPYHHVVPGTDYPAVLLATAESDSRVDPLHARKMAALLQSLAPGPPVLLRVEASGGHGVGKPLTKLIEEQTDIWSFLGWQLGLGGRQEA